MGERRGLQRGRGPIVVAVAVVLVVAALATCSVVAMAFGIGLFVGSNAAEEAGQSDHRPLVAESEGAPADAPADSPETPGASTTAPSAAGNPADASGLPEDRLAPTSAPGGPTARLSPTPGPSPTVPPAMEVEDWDRFETTDALLADISLNQGWANNSVTVELETSSRNADRPSQPSLPSVLLSYEIRAEPPNDYVGFEWNLDEPQDWRGFDQLSVSIRTADDSDRQLVVQFHEISGEVWRHRVLMPPSDVEAVDISLNPAEWEWADWSENRDLEMDLESVTRMGIFVGHTGPGAGTVSVGPITVVAP